jgi:hypothetical protein
MGKDRGVSSAVRADHLGETRFQAFEMWLYYRIFYDFGQLGPSPSAVTGVFRSIRMPMPHRERDDAAAGGIEKSDAKSRRKYKDAPPVRHFRTFALMLGAPSASYTG